MFWAHLLESSIKVLAPRKASLKFVAGPVPVEQGTRGQWDNDDSFVNNFVTTFTQNIRRIQTFSCASYAFIYCSIFLFLDPIGSLVFTFVRINNIANASLF